MKNSISKKLIGLYGIAFFIMMFFTLIIANSMLNNPYNTSNLNATSDSIYVELTQRTNDIEAYINYLSNLYKVDIALTDKEGNVQLKSELVDNMKIDINKIINDKIKKSGDSNNFTKLYTFKYNDEELNLIISANRNVLKDVMISWLKMLIPLVSILVFLYIVTRIKLKQFKYICNGIVQIGSGNLEYKLEKQSDDEFGVLVDEINTMSYELKSKIDNEKNVYKFKNELITNISHDLRTPLTSLTGYIQLANNEDIDNNKRKSYIEKALIKSERIKTLLEELFEYSKLEAGEVILKKNKINIIEMLEQCIGEYSNLSVNKNLSIEKQYYKSEIIADIDGEQFIRVFNNILENAIKYSKNNTIIHVNVINSNTIVFKNTSEKLMNNNANRFCERFYRGDESRNQDVNGSGLGLFIAKSIIELHGGKIEVKTNEYDFEVYIYINEYYNKNKHL